MVNDIVYFNPVESDQIERHGNSQTEIEHGKLFHMPVMAMDTDQVSYNLIQFWHCIPWDRVRFHRFRVEAHKTAHPPSDPRSKRRLSPVLLNNGVHIACSRTSSSGSVSSARGLTELRETFHLLSSGHRTGKVHFSFQSQRKAMPKNAQTTAQLHSSHTLVK